MDGTQVKEDVICLTTAILFPGFELFHFCFLEVGGTLRQLILAQQPDRLELSPFQMLSAIKLKRYVSFGEKKSNKQVQKNIRNDK